MNILRRLFGNNIKHLRQREFKKQKSKYGLDPKKEVRM